MSDLCMYVFEDTVWSDFGRSYDHTGIQTRTEVTEVTSSTEDRSASRYVSKRREEGGFPIMSKRRSIMLDKGTLSHSDSESIKEASTSASDNDSLLRHSFKSSNTDLNGSEFCDTVLNSKTSAVGNNSFSYPLGDIAQTSNNLDFLGNAEGKDPSEFLYYGWPEIGNFEDVDSMLRCCDSTFGKDDLGWLSSADDKSHCRFPSPVSKMAENISESQKSSNGYSIDDFAMKNEAIRHKDNSWPSDKSDPYMSFFNGPAIAQDKDEAILKEQFLGVNGEIQPEIETNSHSSILTGGETINEQRKQPNLQNQYIGKTEEDYFGNGSFSHDGSLSSEVLQLSSGATSYQASASMCIQQEHQASGSVYGYQQNLVPYAKTDNCLLFNPPSENPISSTVKSGANGSSQFTAVDGSGKKETKHGCQGANSVVPLELGSSSDVQESSTFSSGLDDISLEAAGFRQLHLITEQSDLRTKLCIRDSLYRLARSAEQRHNHLNGALMADSFMDMEKDTNPIDRSIAYLLFHRPSESSAIPKDSVLLNPPAVVNGSATNAPDYEKAACKMEGITDG